MTLLYLCDRLPAFAGVLSAQAEIPYTTRIDSESFDKFP